jgi:hypothetical protein
MPLRSFELSPEQVKEEERFLGICKKWQGEYLPGSHGPGSWATTYSNEFIEAAVGLYKVYNSAELSPWDKKHLHRISRDIEALIKANLRIWILYHMAEKFRDAKIGSCRSSEFTPQKMEYLYNNHMRALLTPPN